MHLRRVVGRQYQWFETEERQHIKAEEARLREAGVVGQPGIPREGVTRINAESNRALQVPEVRERLGNIAAEVLGGTPEDLSAMIRADFDRYGRVARDNKIKAE